MTDQKVPRPLVAVLVDFDNATIGARKEGHYQLSFVRLREYVRQFGQVVFADVFLSPKSTTLENVGMVWSAGFTPIACPRERKDKDAVDAQIKARGRLYIEHSHIQMLVIVSEDQDFAGDPNFVHGVRDLGKEIRFVSVSKLADVLAGTNEARVLQPSRKLQTYTGILERMESDQPVEGWEPRFITAVFAELLRISLPYGFKRLCDLVWPRITLFHEQVSPHDLDRLLSAMIEKSLIQKLSIGEGVAYRLNRDHPWIKRTLVVAPVAQPASIPEPALEVVRDLVKVKAREPGSRASRRERGAIVLLHRTGQK